MAKKRRKVESRKNSKGKRSRERKSNRKVKTKTNVKRSKSKKRQCPKKAQIKYEGIKELGCQILKCVPPIAQIIDFKDLVFAVLKVSHPELFMKYKILRELDKMP